MTDFQTLQDRYATIAANTELETVQVQPMEVVAPDGTRYHMIIAFKQRSLATDPIEYVVLLNKDA